MASSLGKDAPVVDWWTVQRFVKPPAPSCSWWVCPDSCFSERAEQAEARMNRVIPFLLPYRQSSLAVVS